MNGETDMNIHNCHKVADKPGRAFYPVLTTVAQRHVKDWESRWLKDPHAVKPDTIMPNFHLTPEEIDAVVEYLYQ